MTLARMQNSWSSLSHMTAAKVLDVVSRLPGCAGQVSDAVSAYSREQWRTCNSFWDYQNQSAQLFDSSTTILRPKSLDEIEDPVVSPERNLCGHPTAGLLWERLKKKVLIKNGSESSKLGMFVHAPRKGLVSFRLQVGYKKGRKEKQSETHVGHIDETN